MKMHFTRERTAFLILTVTAAIVAVVLYFAIADSLASAECRSIGMDRGYVMLNGRGYCTQTFTHPLERR